MHARKKRCVDATARANSLRAHARSMPSTRAHRRVERVFRHRTRTCARDTRAPRWRSSATCVHVAQIACRAQAISNLGWNDVRASMMQTPSACMPMHDDSGHARRRRACSAQRRRRHGRRSPAEPAAHRKPCSATTENRVQLRLKRGCFTTIEELLYGHSWGFLLHGGFPKTGFPLCSGAGHPFEMLQPHIGASGWR